MSSVLDRKTRGQYTVAVLSKTLDIFDILRNSVGGVTLTEISVALKYAKSTVFRILCTLENRGYIERRNGSKYRLTQKFGISDSPDRTMQQLMTLAPPVMQRLLEKHQETVNLGILDGGEIIVLHAIESPLTIRMSSKAGNRRQIHSTALGKAMIAWKDRKQAERLARLKGLAKLTPHTLTTPEALFKQLAKVRRQGFAEDREENELGGRCVAVPIWNQNQPEEVIAALSVSGPTTRMDPRKVKSILVDLMQVGKQLSKALEKNQLAR